MEKKTTYKELHTLLFNVSEEVRRAIISAKAEDDYLTPNILLDSVAQELEYILGILPAGFKN